jgi:hypothetical protein
MTDKKVDESWKEEARREKEKLAEETKDAPSCTPPEASFALVVSSFVAQALIAMGQLKSPVDGKQMLDLDAAKFSIDILQVLEDKTKGNLTDEEDKMLQDALYDLRMRYVQASS